MCMHTLINTLRYTDIYTHARTHTCTHETPFHPGCLHFICPQDVLDSLLTKVPVTVHLSAVMPATLTEQRRKLRLGREESPGHLQPLPLAPRIPLCPKAVDSHAMPLIAHSGMTGMYLRVLYSLGQRLSTCRYRYFGGC